MQNIVGSIAQSFGIPPQIAGAAVSGLTALFLKKSTPKAASGLLSALPKDVTDKFSEEDKQKFTGGPENLNRYDVLKQLSGITGIKDIDKLDALSDNIIESIEKNTNVNVKDGLSKEELFQALNDLKRQQQA